MEYGHSSHYQGDAGENYFIYQNQWQELSGKLNANKFQKYIRHTDHILDFGCGGGWLLRELNAAYKIGVELNPAARKQCELNDIPVVSAVELVPRQVDVVISNHCLEHVPYPIEALRQLREKIKPGGSLILVVPFDDWRTQPSYDPTDVNHHLHTWSPLLLGHTLSEAGFKVESVAMLTIAWPPKVALLYRILPKALFNLMNWLWAVVMNRRQVIAVARA